MQHAKLGTIAFIRWTMGATNTTITTRAIYLYENFNDPVMLVLFLLLTLKWNRNHTSIILFYVFFFFRKGFFQLSGTFGELRPKLSKCNQAGFSLFPPSAHGFSFSNILRASKLILIRRRMTPLQPQRKRNCHHSCHALSRRPSLSVQDIRLPWIVPPCGRDFSIAVPLIITHWESDILL